MKTKLLVILLASGLMLSLQACSSSDGDAAKDTETADAPQDPALDTEAAQATKDMDKPADDQSADSAKSDDSATQDNGAKDDFAKDEEVVADSGDDTDKALPDQSTDAKADAKSTDDKTSDDLLADDSASTDKKDGAELADGSVSNDATKDEGVFDNAPADSSSASAADATTDTSAAATADASAPVENTPKPVASLKKVKDAPFKQGGQLLNTVYVARQGDTWGSVTEKIYGSQDQEKTLKKANPYLKTRELKVGDKVYYNSPKRPQDSQKMLTYYEDSGIPAQTYVAKDGDNIHVVSTTLLGDKNSWKEVWETNPAVDSKGDLAAGTELRYWSADAAAAATAQPEASNTPPPAPVAAAQANNNQPKQKDDFALPDDMAKNQNAQNQNPTAPAAGTVAVEPPPPPPPPPVAQPMKTVASKDIGMNKDMTFMLSAGGLLLVGIGVLLGIIRKSRARKMSMNTHTQI